MKRLAGALANSPPLQAARKLWEENQKDWNLLLSRMEKLLVGTYLILNDYSIGCFPPTFDDQQKAYDDEIAYRHSLPGLTVTAFNDTEMRKPFWFGKSNQKYLTNFVDLVEVLELIGVHPPQRLLELGCGSGWMAELLAIMRFDVIGTTISPYDVDDAQARLRSLQEKNIITHLEFRAAAMESVYQAIRDRTPFDAVFVYEALHHAYDWHQALESSYLCLRPGGWLIIANEPNVIHTCVSYRVAKLSNTHEIGLARNALVKSLDETGFVNIKVVRNAFSFFVKPHWIAAQKHA